MISGWLESNIFSIITVGASVVYFVARLDSSNKAHKEFFKSEVAHLSEIINLNHKNLQDDLQRLREKNEYDIKDLKKDIERLETKQAESNCIKERLAIAEVSLKAAHHRADTLELKLSDKLNKTIDKK